MKVFQPFRLDTVNYCLWRAEERVAITPKGFDVLRYLVERAPRLVSQEEILEALWPETYVNSEVVKRYILEIRKVLGDRPGKPVFIETAPKRGYRFVAPVSDDSRPVSTEVSSETAQSMVGRQATLTSLDGFLDQASSGRTQVIFVTGDAGIGKTTVVDAFHQRAVRRPDLRVARGQCVEGFGGKEAYYPLLEAFGHLIQGGDAGSVVQTLARRAPTWLIQFPSLVKPEERDALQREILGATRERMVREICEALEAITADRPLLLILEDLHWVDPSTLDVLSALARRRSAARLMLLGTYRPVDVIISQNPLKVLKHDLQIHGLCNEIAIEALQESEIAEYLAMTFAAHRFPAGLAGMIYRHSGGNALFMTVLAQDMVKNGLIAKHDGMWALTKAIRDVDPGVPDTLHDILIGQFERLSPPEQFMLKSASVAGEQFSVWAISPTIDIEPEEIELLCEGLAERQQVIRAAGFQEFPNGISSPRYEFRHSLYRHVLYRALSDATRSRLHRKVGERLETVCSAGRQETASEVALHFERGREYQKSINYLMLSAETAVRRFAHRDAIEVLQHALDLAPKVAESDRVEPEVQILQRMGDAHYALGAMSESALAYESAAARAAEADLKRAQIDALSGLAVPAWYADPGRGAAACQQAVEVSRNLGDPRLLAETQLAEASFRLIYDAWRKEDADACASASEAIGRSNIPGFAFYVYVLAVQGDYKLALNHAEALMMETASPRAYILALGAKTVALLHLGRFGEALRIVRNGREMAEKNGDDPWVFIFREAWLRTLCFDFEGVRRLSKIIMRSNAEQHAVQPKTIAMVASGYAELDQEQYEQALRYFARVRDLTVTPKFFLHWYWRIQAQVGTCAVLLRAGNLASGRREADDLLSSALSTADPNLHALAWEMNARVSMAEENWRGAEEYIDHALAVLERFDIPVTAWRVHATAWDIFRHGKLHEAAEAQRLRAQKLILTIANSFEPDEPLRHTFLAAPSIAGILPA